MNIPKRWQIRFAYTAIFLLLGISSATYGFARPEKLPTGKEVAQSIQHVTSETKNSGEAKSSALVSESKKIVSDRQERVEKETVKDFPSPVKAEPFRKVGTYYSENLKAYLFHAGMDYEQAEGAVVRATHGGKVIFAGPDPILGQKVEIDCGDNWHVVYGGLENLRVKEGDTIEVNEALGQIAYFPGADGVNDRPQLHYEVWHGDEVQIPY